MGLRARWLGRSGLQEWWPPYKTVLQPVGLVKEALVVKAVHMAALLSHIYLPCWLSFLLKKDLAFTFFFLLTHWLTWQRCPLAFHPLMPAIHTRVYSPHHRFCWGPGFEAEHLTGSYSTLSCNWSPQWQEIIKETKRKSKFRKDSRNQLNMKQRADWGCQQQWRKWKRIIGKKEGMQWRWIEGERREWRNERRTDWEIAKLLVIFLETSKPMYRIQDPKGSVYSRTWEQVKYKKIIKKGNMNSPVLNLSLILDALYTHLHYCWWLLGREPLPTMTNIAATVNPSLYFLCSYGCCSAVQQASGNGEVVTR